MHHVHKMPQASSDIRVWSRLRHVFDYNTLPQVLNLTDKGAIIFFRIGGGAMKKLGGSQNFFMINRGGHKKIKRFLDGYKF